MRLDLRAPLFFAPAPLVPFAYTTEAGSAPVQRACNSQIFCFELDPDQSRSIEPDRKRFLGKLLFAGMEKILPADGAGAESRQVEKTILLPAGLYLFSQKREALCREECIDLAIEQQKDGLWERLKPEALLSVRYLFEDGKAVTQIFRPYS